MREVPGNWPDNDVDLRHADALEAAIVECIADGIVMASSTGRIYRMNSAAARLFDVDLEQTSGRNIGEFLDRRDCARLRAAVRQFSLFGTSPLFDSGLEMSGFRSADGAFPIHVRVREMPKLFGSCYVATVNDISEQTAQRTQVLRQNERLHATIDYSPTGIITFDNKLNIVAANSAFAGMIGVAPGNIVGRHLSAFVHPEDVARVIDESERSFADDVKHFSMRLRYVHDDGHVIHAALHVAIGHDANDCPEFGVANIEDLTPRLDAAALIRDQQDKLARVDRSSSLGEMTAGIAHEINQPLTAIATFAHAAMRFLEQDEPDSARLKEALVKLSEQSLRASAIVERLRALARQGETRNELIDCSELMRETIELIDPDAQYPDIEFRMELAEGLPGVVCDRIQLQRVILNLVRNAIESIQRADNHAMQRIVLSTESTTSGSVRISVEDSGVGVDEAVGARLFEPFSSADSTRLGMGLSTARSVLTSCGGTVEYRNNESVGATFTITLPGSSGESNDE